MTQNALSNALRMSPSTLHRRVGWGFPLVKSTVLRKYCALRRKKQMKFFYSITRINAKTNEEEEIHNDPTHENDSGSSGGVAED